MKRITLLMSSLLTAFTMVSFAATSFSQEGPRNPIEIPLKSTLGKTRTKPKRLVTWNLILGHSLKERFYPLNFSKSARRQSMSWIPEDRLFLPNLRKDSSMNQCLFVFLHEATSILSSSGAPTSMEREPL